MKKTDKIRTALLAVCPTVASFKKFTTSDEDASALNSLISLAFEQKLIEKEERQAFYEFIQKNGFNELEFNLPEDFNFELFLEQKSDFLELNLSLRVLTNRINSLLLSQKVNLPKITNSMMTRLKREMADTPHKQSVLRSLAFWIGYNRPHLITKWNFESLLAICRSGKQLLEYKTGVRIGFALSGRGDVIDHEIVGWLRKNLKSYIESAIQHFSFSHWGKVRSHDITTLYVDFPKEELFNSPAGYRKCLRSAFSLAHQICIRWALTRYNSYNRFLAIGISAGEFSSLDNHLLPILRTKLPGDPVIRLTDFARQCALINDIRVIFCNKPTEITLFTGENLVIWWVEGVWNTLYFDFIPELLDDPLLGNDLSSTKRLYSYLMGIESDSEDINKTAEPSNAIVTFLRFPHNFMLGMEISKTLYYRRRFREAIFILKIILNVDPTYIPARTLLMILFRNLCLIAPNNRISEGLFEQAENEAHFIVDNCAHYSEDFYCEYAVIYLTKAMMKLKTMRTGASDDLIKSQTEQLKEDIFTNLKKSEKLFSTAMMTSLHGVRAHYLNNTVKVIICALENDESIFTDPKRRIDGDPKVIQDRILDSQWQYGAFRKDIPQSDPFRSMEKVFTIFIQNHNDSIALQAYQATTQYCSAITLWDLFPLRTVAIAKRVLGMLHTSVKLAKEMDRKGVCINSFSRIYCEMLPANEFIAHANRCIQLVQEYCGEDNKHKGPNEILASKKNEKLPMLMTLNF